MSSATDEHVQTTPAPGRWTNALLLLAGSVSIVFTIGTALQAFVIVNQDTLTRMMILAVTLLATFAITRTTWGQVRR